ncbi:MAG: AMIN domain-containing protein, partial [Candidatus Aminicenantes bacterium]|nr:AMIN domain-containing protein [Candidatus Aminicenantes bacterium]
MRRTYSLLFIFLLVGPGFIAAQDESEATLKNISLEKTQDRLGIKLDIDTPINYESFTLFNPDRLIIDLLGITSFSCQALIDVNDQGVLTIRTAKNQPDVTRIVFDLMEEMPAYSIEEKEDGLYIYFEIEKPLFEEQPDEVKEIPPVKEEIKEEIKQPEKTEQPKIEPAAKKVPPLPELKTISTPEAKKNKILTLGFGGGFYFIQDADFQDVYGKSAGFFGGELNFYIPIKNQEGIAIAVDFKSISTSGLTTITEEEVKLKLTPFSFGAMYMRHYGRFIPFVGLGGAIFSYEEIYPPSFAIPSTKGSTFGLNLQIGTYIKVVETFSFKVYFKFHDARTKENDLNINLGGNEYGIGLA